MSNWEEKAIKDICISITSGGTPSRSISEYYSNGNICWVKTKELNNFYIYDTEEKITENAIRKSSAKLLPKNTVLLAMYGATVGETAILGKEMACNQACCAMIVNENIVDYRFLFYLLILHKTKIKNLATGAAQQNISVKMVKELTFRIPEKELQIKIANILESLDQKIILNTQTNQTLEQIAQGIFKHWFIDFAPVHAKANALARGETTEQAELAAMACLSGKTVEKITALKTQDPTAYHQLQQTAAAFPREFVETEMGKVPRGWECLKIEQVIKKIPVGKKYSQKNTFPEGHIPVLDQGKSGIIGFHNDTAGVKASIQDPVIVFANHTCYMRLIHFDFSAIQNVFAFKGQDVNIYWLYLATLGKQKFVEYKGHFPDFLIKQIVVPPKELTEFFGNIVKDSFSKIALNLNTNEKLAKTRDLLLPKLLNGELTNGY
ncbi:restriction endonuclease subunit S [Avibacterium volantium]|uniref:EcoKI restriction-modification system protein HsdS n=1 Tax=Avibacterium volantium TaxID=762 RepID=A0A447SS88_AVIVO|nr:restriction endonuclease subunit S [Avibacterium volantium]VEB24850.1 EcoKI restriction-modification system protein HsdS [Avibacterium volantium]